MSRAFRRPWLMRFIVAISLLPGVTVAFVSVFSPQHRTESNLRSRWSRSAGCCGRGGDLKRVRRERTSLSDTTRQIKVSDSVSPSSDVKDILIEPASWDDLKDAARLLAEAFHSEGIFFSARCLKELHTLQSNFHSWEEDCRHQMFVARDLGDNAVAGFVDINGRKKRTTADMGPPRPYLSDLVVAEHQQHRGIGTALVRACEKMCLQWGYDSIYLKVAKGNVPAEDLYRRLGYVLHKPPNNKDEVTLRKRLSRTKRGVAMKRDGDAEVCPSLDQVEP